MTDEIPYWALQRAAELANREGGEVGAARGAYTPDELACTYIGRTFARYIAQHEEQPVDPVEQAAAKIRRDYFDNHYLTTMEAFEAALRRGIELGKAGAA